MTAKREGRAGLGVLGKPAASVELAGQVPGVRWPADWRVQGEAFGRAEWSADVHGDLTQYTGQHTTGRLLVHTQLGTFAALAMIVSVDVDSAGAVTRLIGQGPLAYVHGPDGER